MASRNSRFPVGFFAYSTFVVWLAAAFGAHVTMAIVAPGDVGTLLGLLNIPVIPILLVISFLPVLLIFPLAAVASWPLRKLAFEKPAIAYAISAAVGLVAGAIASTFIARSDSIEQLPCLVAGAAGGLAWVWMVRRYLRKSDAHDTGVGP